MAVTLEQMRRARRRDVPAGKEGWVFTIELPTEMELFALLDDESRRKETEFVGRVAQRVVVGWKGLKESDLLPSATDDPAEFDREVYRYWIADRPELWAPIADAMFAMRKEQLEAREVDAKN